MTTFAESCNDREMQRPRSDKLETAQSPQDMHEILCRLMAVGVSSAFRKSLIRIVRAFAAATSIRVAPKEESYEISRPALSLRLPGHPGAPDSIWKRRKGPPTPTLSAIRLWGRSARGHCRKFPLDLLFA